FSYDAISELTHAIFASANPSVANQDLTYVYDAVGNRTQTVINGVATTYTTNNLNEYTRVGGTAYEDDGNGNMISATDANGTTTYDYDPNNQLVGVRAPGSVTSSFQYDVFGYLYTATQDGQQTNYLVNPVGGNVVGQFAASGDLVAHYIYGLGL